MVISKESREWLNKILELGNLAVLKAQKENREMGFPNVYSKDGEKYYELPDGTKTTNEPEIFKSKRNSRSSNNLRTEKQPSL